MLAASHLCAVRAVPRDYYVSTIIIRAIKHLLAHGRAAGSAWHGARNDTSRADAHHF
jgi:hypothetical protein